MRKPRPGQGEGLYYLVLNRSYADLLEAVLECFEDRPCIEVIVDRRRGEDRMAELPTPRRRVACRRDGRANPRLISVWLRKEAS